MSRSLSWLALVLLLASPVPGQVIETTVVEVGAGQALVFADAARTPPAIGQVVAGQAYVRVASQGGMAKVLWSSKGPTHAWIEEQALTLAEGRKKYLVADTAAGFGVGWVVAPMGIDELLVGPDTDGTMIVAHAGSTLTVSTKSLLEAGDAGPRIAAPTPSSTSPTAKKTPGRKRSRPVAPASDGSQPTPAVRSDTPPSDRPVEEAKKTRPRVAGNGAGRTTPDAPTTSDERASTTDADTTGDATEGSTGTTTDRTRTDGRDDSTRTPPDQRRLIPVKAGRLDLDREVYPARSPEAVALFEEAARVAKLPLWWARSEGLHNVLARESGGWVGRPNFTYNTPTVQRSLAENRAYWPAIHAELKRGKITAVSSATGLGQLLLRNVKKYYPGREKGIGDPLSEAVGMLRYIRYETLKDGRTPKHGDPDRAWANYNRYHQGY